MNNLSQCIFDISHVNKNLRDTLEFVLPNEITAEVFDGRKKVVSSVLDGKSFLSKFISDNEEKLKDFKKNYQEYLDEVYGEDSTILVKNNEGKVRVDHSQNIAIYKGVVYLGETFRDILFSHIMRARQDHLDEKSVTDYIDLDERFDRAIKTYLLIQEYQKSFMEFQKVMTEAKGQPTPQSNFIVQNELNVVAGMLRFERAHCHFTDNYSLDRYDRVIQLIEMCEGKRDRRDNKNFPDLFKEALEGIGVLVNENGPKYNEAYQSNLKDMLATIEQNKNNNPGTEA